MTAPEPTPAVERTAEALETTIRAYPIGPREPWMGGQPLGATMHELARAALAAALDVEEMAEMLVPVVYAQNPSHYEDGEGFIRVKPWEWLTEGYQEMIRAEAREYVGYVRAHLLGGAQ